MRISQRIWQFAMNVCRNYALDNHTQHFIKHNEESWSGTRSTAAITPEVLFEFNPFHSAIIAYSYLANVLAEKYNAQIVAFSRMDRARWIAHANLPSNAKRIYQSFNASRFVNAKGNRKQTMEADRLLRQVCGCLKSKRDLEDLTVGGVWIGDLVYDTYLKDECVPTVDLSSEKFIASLRQSLECFVFWRDYFDTHEVKAINVSHCVYRLAIPMRIAVNRGIPAYQANATHVYRLSKTYLFAYNDFLFFPEKFRELPYNEQEAGLRDAAARIGRRLSGEVGVDMPYSRKSAYGNVRGGPVIRKSARKKILIAAHCFFDSPHSYGKNLFPDFYEWLTFLGKISERTNYDWYIKTHPDYLPETRALIELFCERFHKLVLLPSDTSHHQLVSEGIDVALTVYGTIGFEYAAMGLTVINASQNNPHVAYKFNIHPKSVEEYESILMNLDRYEAEIEKREVYEYYFMKFIYNTEDWLFDDYSKMVKDVGVYTGQFTPRVYGIFLSRFNRAKHNKVIRALRTFVDSGDFRLNRDHFQKAAA